MHAGAHRAFRAWRTAGNGLKKDAAGKAKVIKLNKESPRYSLHLCNVYRPPKFSPAW